MNRMIPTLELRQGDGTVYLCAIEAKQLSTYATVSRISRDDTSSIKGYQRPEVLRHVRDIREYLEKPGSFLPNSIIIAFDERVSFLPSGGDGPMRQGMLIIPDGDEPAGFIVDGQQRSAALRDANLPEPYLVPVVAFIAGVEVQREQFILVNNVKPLPKGLIHELLPDTNVARLPEKLVRKREPMRIVNALNHRAGSSLLGMIKTPTASDGVLKDTSMMMLLENSLTNGVLWEEARNGPGVYDIDVCVRVVSTYFAAVKATWPEAWGLKPRKSRLSHGAGIVALGLLMDSIAFDLGTTYEDFLKGLARIKPLCAWTKGEWAFGRKWNEIQNTSQDRTHLAMYLVRAYTSKKERK